MKRCKFYDTHLETINTYITALYNLPECGTGGLLHIVLDDGNVDDESITFCLKGCAAHPEREEWLIGMLICSELLKLPEEKRRLLDCLAYRDFRCQQDYVPETCESCYIATGKE